MFVVDAVSRGSASFFTDDVQVPRIAATVARPAAVRSLLKRIGHPRVADAPGLAVYDLRYIDRSSGAGLTQVRIPQDVGMDLHVEVELFGVLPQPVARYVRVRLRADLGLGEGDPIIAEETSLVPAGALDLKEYGSRLRPVVSVPWHVQDVPGAAGVYVEVEEPRVSLQPGAAPAELLYTTHLSSVELLTTGRPHYDQYYTTYGTDLGSLFFKR